jgi:hypothetical protein
MRIIYELIRNYWNYFDYNLPVPTENLVLHWTGSKPRTIISTGNHQNLWKQRWLTCRSSNANCVVPLVTESTESDNEFGTDCWAKTQAHNMVNNTPEIKWQVIKYLNSLHIRVLRWKGVYISTSENVCSPWEIRNNLPYHLKNLIFILLKRMKKYTVVILQDS